MKKLILIVLLIGVGSLEIAVADPPGTPTPTPDVKTNCPKQSYSPEMHTFYGNKGVILQKLTDWPAKPAEHRVFVQITQGKNKGSAKFFERSEDGKSYTVTTWTVNDPVALLQALDKAIMDNQGVNCVGQQMKAVLDRLPHGSTFHDVADPVSALAAFSHAVQEASSGPDDFMKTVIIFGC